MMDKARFLRKKEDVKLDDKIKENSKWTKPGQDVHCMPDVLPITEGMWKEETYNVRRSLNIQTPRSVCITERAAWISSRIPTHYHRQGERK